MTENALKISSLLTEFPENALETPEYFFTKLPSKLVGDERKMVLSHFEALSRKYSRKNSNPHKFFMLTQYLASQDEWSDLFSFFINNTTIKKELDSPRMGRDKVLKPQKDYTFFEFCLRYTLMFNCHKNLNTLFKLDKPNKYARIRNILTNDKMVKEFPGLFDIKLYNYLRQNTRSILTKLHFEQFIALIEKYNKKENILVEHYKVSKTIKTVSKKRAPPQKEASKFKI